MLPSVPTHTSSDRKYKFTRPTYGMCYLEFVILRSVALAAGEAPPVVSSSLLRHLLGLEHGPATLGTGLALVERFEAGGVTIQSGGGRSDGLGEASPTVKGPSMEMS